MNNILYASETSAKSGKNVDRMFTDCARFIYHKYKDRMHEVGNGGAADLSVNHGNEYDDEGDFDEGAGHRGRRNRGSFSQSKGHKAGRLNSKPKKNGGKSKSKCC